MDNVLGLQLLSLLLLLQFAAPLGIYWTVFFTFVLLPQEPRSKEERQRRKNQQTIGSNEQIGALK